MNVVPLKRKTVNDPICETPTYRRVTQLLEMCHTRGAMGRIIGKPGVGKSVAIRRFTDSTGFKSKAYFHEVSVEHAESMAKFLKSLRDSTGIHAYGTANSVRVNITNHLRLYGGTLIMDEAQKLSPKTVELLREIHDSSGCGLVLCGNHDIASRFGNTRPSAFAQIESRISYRLEIDGSSEGDIRAVCDHEGIGNARTIAKLVKLGQGPLGLRIVADAIAQTRLIIGDRAITPGDVDKTLGFMGVQL